jgi:hypothetical protein
MRLRASLLLSVLVPTAANAAGFEALVHHWNFDEGPDWHDAPFQGVSTATVARDSAGSAHATLQGMTGSAFASGRQYTALTFDGVDDHLQLASDVSTTLGGTATFSFWLRTDLVGNDDVASAPCIAGSGGIRWGYLDGSGKIGLAINGLPVAMSQTAVNDSRWHFVAITRNAASGAVQIHLDGVLSTSATGLTGAIGGAINRIGQTGSSAFFKGRLDQLHVFNGVMDAATLLALRDNHAPKTWTVECDGTNNAPFGTPSVLVNTYAYDAEQDTLTLASFTQPAHGTATANADGSFQYTASPGFTGTDSFTATISDGKGGYHATTVNLWVSSPPPAGSQNRTLAFTNLQTVSAAGSEIALSGWRCPRAFDWDKDGDLDLLLGHGTRVWRYNNSGTAAAPVFDAGVMVQANGSSINLSSNTLIALQDITGDGVTDLIAVDSSKKIRIYRNTAAANVAPVFAAATILQKPGGGDWVMPDQRFDCGDWNGDGLPDIVTGSFSGDVLLFLNQGTAAAPSFPTTANRTLENGSYNLFPRLFDINRNGTRDYIRSVNWGNVDVWTDPVRSSSLGSSAGKLTFRDTLNASVSDATIKTYTDGVIGDFADFNNDGVIDIILGGHSGDRIRIAYGDATSVADSIAAIEAIYDANPANLGTALEANTQQLLNEIKDAERNIILHSNSASLPERQGYFTLLTAHIAKYPFLSMALPLDTAVYHHVPGIAGQNLMTLHQMLPDTPGYRLQVANAVGLTGLHRDIYLQMGLHVGDNQKGTQGQLESIRDFMWLQPRESFPDAMVTLDHYYNDGRGGHVDSFRGSKNTFNFGEGGNSTEWAGDLNAAAVAFYGSEVQRGDYFTFVLGHEVTHSLDGYVVNRANTDLWRRKGQVLTLAAGPLVVTSNNDDLGFWNLAATKAKFQTAGLWDGNAANWTTAWSTYWASGSGSAFRDLAFMRGGIDWFLDNSQEAMATQANHHWAHAEARLIGALDRWQRGVNLGIEPMKANLTEVVTFLDWISCGMNRIVMQDTTGVSTPYPHAAYLTTRAWIERNDKGYITRLTMEGRNYEFTVDESGIITGIVDAPFLHRPDEAWVVKDTAHLIKPLGNDTAYGATVPALTCTQPAHGAVTAEAGGLIVYTPTTGYTGTDSFAYTTSPGTPAATVRILVANPATSQTGILLDTWTGLSGNNVSNLTSSTNFPFVPNTSVVRSNFTAPTNRAESFGARMAGLLVPPTTGDYTFWIASDDSSELRISSDRTRREMDLIASVSGYTSALQWNAQASQQSVTIPLIAGKPYLIEALHKEGGGGDHLAVAWQGPGITQDVIASTYLKTIDRRAPVVSQPVASVQVVENAAPGTIPVGSVFTDPDLGDSVSVSLIGNTNPGLVIAAITDGTLTLTYAPGAIGTTTISLRGVDLEGSITPHSFTVTVLNDHDNDGIADINDPDDDNDGMPDTWETANGLNPLADDTTGDPDSDGWTNQQEFIAGTLPGSGASFLKLQIEPGLSSKTLRFPTSAGRRYTIWYHDELGPGAWSQLAAPVNGNGSEQTQQDSTGGLRRFYKLQVELTP